MIKAILKLKNNILICENESWRIEFLTCKCDQYDFRKLVIEYLQGNIFLVFIDKSNNQKHYLKYNIKEKIFYQGFKYIKNVDAYAGYFFDMYIKNKFQINSKLLIQNFIF